MTLLLSVIWKDWIITCVQWAKGLYNILGKSKSCKGLKGIAIAHESRANLLKVQIKHPLMHLTKHLPRFYIIK